MTVPVRVGDSASFDLVARASVAIAKACVSRGAYRGGPRSWLAVRGGLISAAGEGSIPGIRRSWHHPGARTRTCADTCPGYHQILALTCQVPLNKRTLSSLATALTCGSPTAPLAAGRQWGSQSGTQSNFAALLCCWAGQPSLARPAPEPTKESPMLPRELK